MYKRLPRLPRALGYARVSLGLIPFPFSSPSSSCLLSLSLSQSTIVAAQSKIFISPVRDDFVIAKAFSGPRPKRCPNDETNVAAATRGQAGAGRVWPVPSIGNCHDLPQGSQLCGFAAIVNRAEGTVRARV